jgi:homoserine acetyltransferase
MRRIAAGCLFMVVGLTGLGAQELKIAQLGTCPLENRSVIHDCELGYRTFGTLDSSKSNAILVPTWASGRSEQMGAFIGPGKFIDSSKYFIVVIDAFANGVSSSPSNSRAQPRMQFPEITIHDMVVAEHELVTRELHLNHLFAVLGQSMGGMQTFDWIVSYPEFMDKAIPIVGSPKLASYDLLLWQTEIDAIKTDPAWMNGDYKTNPAVLAEARIGFLTLMTPAWVNANIRHGQITSAMLAAAGEMDANDHIRQAEAMIAQDISKNTNGSMEAAAERVKAKVLVIVSKQDHTVTPQPALAFAKLLNAPTLEIDSPCGHIATYCEMGKVSAAVSDFLAQ